MHIMKRRLFIPLEVGNGEVYSDPSRLSDWSSFVSFDFWYCGTYIYMASALGLGFIFRISLLILLALNYSLVAPRHFSLYICIGSIYI